MVTRRCTSDSLWSKCSRGASDWPDRRRSTTSIPAVEKVVGDDLMPPVGAPLEVAGKYRVCLEQRIEGSRQGVDVDRALARVRRDPRNCVSQRAFPRCAPASE